VFPPVSIDPPAIYRNPNAYRCRKWEYLFFDKMSKSVPEETLQAAGRVETLVVNFASLDQAGHELGPLTTAFGETLFGFDAMLQRLLDPIREQWSDAGIFLLSDHGMTAIRKAFDVWGYLEKKGYRLGRDFLAFINSTIMSLWFDGETRADVLGVLNESGHGHILNQEERIRFHINFKDRRYGDDIFLADEGIEFVPHYFSLARKPELGVHGYDPAYSSTRAFFIGEKQGTLQPKTVLDLHPLFMAALYEEIPFALPRERISP
jgi:hypothetical protein